MVDGYPGVCRTVFQNPNPGLFLFPMFSGIFSIGGYFGFIPLFMGLFELNENRTESAMNKIYTGIILLSVGEGLSYLINLAAAILCVRVAGANAGFPYNKNNFRESKFQVVLDFIPDISKNDYDVSIGLLVKF